MRILIVGLFLMLSSHAWGKDFSIVCKPEPMANNRSINSVKFRFKNAGKSNRVEIDVFNTKSTKLGFIKQAARRGPASVFQGFHSQPFMMEDGKSVYLIFKPNQIEAGKKAQKKADAGLVWANEGKYVPLHCRRT